MDARRAPSGVLFLFGYFLFGYFLFGYFLFGYFLFEHAKRK